MKIDELSRVSGVTVRNIRKYIDERILRPPLGRTRAASYSESHRRDLARIQALRASGWGLDQIRQEMQTGRATQVVDEHTQAGVEVEHRYLVAPGVRLVFEGRSPLVDPEQVRLLTAKIRQVLIEAAALPKT